MDEENKITNLEDAIVPMEVDEDINLSGISTNHDNPSSPLPAFSTVIQSLISHHPYLNHQQLLILSRHHHHPFQNTRCQNNIKVDTRINVYMGKCELRLLSKDNTDTVQNNNRPSSNALNLDTFLHASFSL